MRSLPLLSLALTLTLALSTKGAEPTVVKLWPGKAPGETKDIGPETLQPNKAGDTIQRLTNVSEPSIAVYPAPKDKATGCAIIVAPGGGYSILAMNHEGTEVCEWLNALGVTAILLKYRVPKREMQMPDNRAAIQDAQRAVSLARSRAKEWNIDPNRIGMLGFSAGGNLTAWACLAQKRYYDSIDDADKQSSRPSFAVLVYPAYLVDKGGELKPEYRATKDSPPMCFVHANDDPVTPLSSVALYSALKKNNVPAELHVYAAGGHGFGMRKSGKPSDTWPDRVGDWLQARGYLKK